MADHREHFQIDSRSIKKASVIALVSVASSILFLVEVPPAGLWLKTAFDAAHVFIFGAIAVAALWLMPDHWRNPKRLVVALIAIVGLGVFSEMIQYPTGRDASLEDLRSDILGGMGATLMIVGWGRLWTNPRVRQPGLIFAGLLLFVFPLIPLARVTAAYAERAVMLPGLIRFDSSFSPLLYRTQHSVLTTVPHPDGSGSSASITMSGQQWAGIAFNDLWPDWSDYDVLEIDVENPNNQPFPLRIRIDDWEHRKSLAHTDRFNWQVGLPIGRQTLTIPLEDVRHAPADREFDLTRVDKVILFTNRYQEGRRLILHDLRLVKR